MLAVLNVFCKLTTFSFDSECVNVVRICIRGNYMQNGSCNCIITTSLFLWISPFEFKDLEEIRHHTYFPGLTAFLFFVLYIFLFSLIGLFVCSHLSVPGQAWSSITEAKVASCSSQRFSNCRYLKGKSSVLYENCELRIRWNERGNDHADNRTLVQDGLCPWVLAWQTHSHGRVFPDHAMKAYRGSRGTAPLILNPGTRWRCIY